MKVDRENLLKVKSFSFALRIVNVYKHLLSENKEFVLSKQLLRSGNSIGANIAEAKQGQSRANYLLPGKRLLKRNFGCVFCVIASILRGNRLSH